MRAAPAAAAVLAYLALGAQGTAAAKAARDHTKPTHVVRLSNETTFTRFAEANFRAKIFVKPKFRSHVITHLQYFTPDAEAVQTYLLLRSERIGRHVWVQLRVPMRPNGHTGWVLRRSLSTFWTTHTEIVVDRESFTLTVLRRGKRIFRARVGVGHFHNPTRPTPTGHFWITEAFPSSDPFYGPWAFGTSDYARDTDFPDGSIVGIHGTNEPNLIPGDISHGCIRLKDANILKLKRYVSIGTPIWVR